VKKHSHFSAKNFIDNSFTNSKTDENLFEIIRSVKKFGADNILIKSNMSIKNPSQYFATFEKQEHETINKLKQLNWKEMYKSNPTAITKQVVELGQGHSTTTIFIPTELKEKETTETKMKASIDTFLLTKVKRSPKTDDAVK
jgi:hypothetical protein